MKTFLVAMFVLALCAPASAVLADDSGFGTFRYTPDTPCLDDAERHEILSVMFANESLLRAQGRLDSPQPSGTASSLGWPVALAPGITDFDCWAIVNFVDQDSTTGSVRDYNCGDRTYDLPTGYNHTGVDFLAWPFSWIKTDNDEMYAVAAQAGIVIVKIDGNPDHNCSMDEGTTANTVIVRHSDGSRALYVHLKSGSLTAKKIGESIAAGEYIGVVGSSGRSPVPHLHLEILDSDGNLSDPFAGPCNSLSSASWWLAQIPYRSPGINKVSTHSQLVEFPPCPQPELPHYQYGFQPGELAFFYAFGHDLVDGMSLTFRLIRPDLVVDKERTFIASLGDFDSFYYWFAATIPFGYNGKWTVEVDFGGQTYAQEFAVGSVAVAFQSVGADAVEGGVAVTWEVVADEAISGYVVRRDGMPVGSAAADVRAFLDTGVRPGQSYTYDVVARLPDGREIVSVAARVRTPDVLASLSQNYPNPFNPTTTIDYALAAEARVLLGVYNVAGRRVALLVDAPEAAGNHTVQWDGTGAGGVPVASGTYFYRLTIDGMEHTRKMVLLK